jgi:hypothetical protein
MKITGTPNAHYHNGFAIVRCTHRREAVWVAYATVAGAIAVPLKEVCRTHSLASAKAQVDWMIANGKV